MLCWFWPPAKCLSRSSGLVSTAKCSPAAASHRLKVCPWCFDLVAVGCFIAPGFTQISCVLHLNETELITAHVKISARLQSKLPNISHKFVSMPQVSSELRVARSESLHIPPTAPSSSRFLFSDTASLGVFSSPLLLHLNFRDLSTRLALVHHSLHGNKARPSHTEPGANSPGLMDSLNRSQTADNRTRHESPACFLQMTA